MSADEIQGIAVIYEPTTDAGQSIGEYLLCLCVPGDGRKPLLGHIPIRQRGTPENGRSSWEYDIQDDLVHVTPSLQMLQRRPDPTDAEKWVEIEIFHGPGDWTVKFERTTTDHQGGYELFRLRNADRYEP